MSEQDQQQSVSALAAVGWGVLLAGAGLFSWSILLPRGTGLSRSGLSGLIAVAVLLGLGVAAVRLARPAQRADERLGSWVRILALGFYSAPILALVLIGFEDLDRDLMSGFPGRDTAALWVSAVVMAMSAVLMTVAWFRRPVHPEYDTSDYGRQVRLRVGARSLGLTVGSAVLVALVAVPVVRAIPGLVVQSTAVAAVEPAPTVSEPSDVAWSIPLPSDYSGDVQSAGAGVVYATSTGVVALDGSTGDQLWSYSRGRGLDHVVALVVAGGGGTVIAVFQLFPGDESRLIALDAFTGVVRWTMRLPTDEDSRGPRLSATEDTLIHVIPDDDSGSRLTGYDVESGERIWQWAPPADCRAVNENGPSASVLEDVVVLLLRCSAAEPEEGVDPGLAEILALDQRTGEPAWRLDFPYEVVQLDESETPPQYPAYSWMAATSARDQSAIVVGISIGLDDKLGASGPRLETLMVLDPAGNLLYDLPTGGDSAVIAASDHWILVQRYSEDCLLVDIEQGSERPFASKACDVLVRPLDILLGSSSMLALWPTESGVVQVTRYPLLGERSPVTIPADVGAALPGYAPDAYLLRAPGAMVIAPVAAADREQHLVGLR